MNENQGRAETKRQRDGETKWTRALRLFVSSSLRLFAITAFICGKK